MGRALTNISIRGDGVAAYCAAHLLGKAGFRVSLRRTDRPRLPAILLSDAALALIREVFELPAAPPDLESEQAARVRCTYPYQKFKPTPIVAIHPDDVHSSTDIGQVQYGSTDTRVHPSGPTVPLHDSPYFATDSRPNNPGIPPALNNPKVGMTDDRPHSATGAGSNAIPAIPASGWNENFNPYCCGQVPPTGVRAPTDAAPTPTPAAPAK